MNSPTTPMSLLERVEKIRTLLPKGSPMPWTIGNLSRLHDAKGLRIIDTTAYDDTVGSRPENDPNAEILMHMSHLAHSDFLFVTPEMQDQTGEVAQLQQEVHDQANRLFPKRTPASIFMKFFEELGEVIKDPEDATEWADLFILLLDLSKTYDIDIVAAVREKMQKNDGRVWGKTPTGTFQHVPQIAVQVAQTMVDLQKLDVHHACVAEEE